MQNAHLRMGRLEYLKAATTPKSTPTYITLSMDRTIVEPAVEPAESPRCHLLSVFGGDQEIGAIAAAIADEARFTVSGPGLDSYMVTLGERPQLFRSSIQVPGRKQPVRHLVALSEQLFQTQGGGNTEADRTIVYSSEPEFLIYRLSVRFGIPGLPCWSSWIAGELHRRKMVQELAGIGCSPVLVKATKQIVLDIIASALRAGILQIPKDPVLEWRVANCFAARND